MINERVFSDKAELTEKEKSGFNKQVINQSLLCTEPPPPASCRRCLMQAIGMADEAAESKRKLIKMHESHRFRALDHL
ncbi:hypothetical protein GWI33_018202 [Rhynchophorus ferrugineus]|uniref:Uncharacterized protein n=1 Tax=Rhynchophorus ferrugineus TaxID=354439 RepID=A0A834HWL0_RHYFE|nr:hypothetical protein GWI33_018202 [Rhynchophorus ferrugineus]